MSTKKIRTIFIGTPDFGIPALQALMDDTQFDVVAVITQTDKKVGRKQILTAPPIKKLALENKIPVLQPERIKNEKLRIKEIRPDLIVVVAYAQIIPKSILDLPKYACINIHGSLLPYCRGAACIQRPILDGKDKTGITIMIMDEGLDTGPILSQHSIPIKNNDTAGSLFEKLSNLSGEKIIPVLKDYIASKIKPIKQNESQANYVCMLTKADGKINLNQSAKKIERFIRAMSPWPGTFVKFANKKIKILKTAHNVLKDDKHKTGELFSFEKKLYLKCKENALEIIELQFEGKKAIKAKDFLCGHKNMIGSILE